MVEKAPKRPKRDRIKLEPEGLSILQRRMREAHQAALDANEREILELAGETAVGESEAGGAPAFPKQNPNRKRKDTDSKHYVRTQNLGGFLSQKYKRELSPATEALLQELFHREANDLDNRLSNLYSGRISLAEFENNFRTGFIKRIKLEMSNGRLTAADESLDAKLRALAVKALDAFFDSLRASEARGDKKNQAFRIAANSHWLPSDAIERLEKQYPAVEKVVLYRAVEGFPTAPEEFIDAYLKRLEGLQANNRMSAVSLGILKYAALKAARNPESFVGHYQRITSGSRESSLYRGIKPNVIERAARRKNSDSFLRAYASRVKTLGGDVRFSQLGKSTIERAARDYTSLESARKFLLWYLNTWEYLVSFGFKKGLIKDVLFSNAFKAKEDLLKLL